MEVWSVVRGVFLAALLVDTVSATANDDAKDLFDRYFRWKGVEVNPEKGILFGLHDMMNGTEINDMSLDFLLDVRNKCRGFSGEAAKLLERGGLGSSQKKYLRVLEVEAAYCDEGFKCPAYLLAPVTFIYGVQSEVPKLFYKDNMIPFNSVQDYRNALVRLSKIPKQLSQITELLEEGVRRNVTHANESIARARSQFQRLQVAEVEDSVFYTKFKAMPQLLRNPDPEDVKAVQDEAKNIIGRQVLPAFRELQDYLYGEYSQHLRPKPGIYSIPGGAECYRLIVKHFTTLPDVTAKEIHSIGLAEVKELQKEAVEVSRKLGYGNISFAELTAKLDALDDQHFSNGNETMDYFRKQMKVIASSLNQTFGNDVLIDEIFDLEAKPVPPGGGGFAYYKSESLDKKRKAAFYINTADPKLIKKYQVLSLAMHEGYPGHHLQYVAGFPGPLVPNFIKRPFPVTESPGTTLNHNAFSEGWALYAESLGKEMGLYDRDMSQWVGFYSWNLLRASRLVVDTGIHEMKWPRQKAVDYLYGNTGMSRAFCEQQIDRYIRWPGQALSYKMGEREILKLRRAKEEEAQSNGETFDLKKFHSRVVTCRGPMMLLTSCYESKASLSGLPSLILTTFSVFAVLVGRRISLC